MVPERLGPVDQTHLGSRVSRCVVVIVGVHDPGSGVPGIHVVID
jgi:hypothetical protein